MINLLTAKYILTWNIIAIMNKVSERGLLCQIVIDKDDTIQLNAAMA